MSLLLLLPVRNFEEIRKGKNRGQKQGKTARVSDRLRVSINDEKSMDVEFLLNLIKPAAIICIVTEVPGFFYVLRGTGGVQRRSFRTIT